MSPHQHTPSLARHVWLSALLLLFAAASGGSVPRAQEAPRRIEFERGSSSTAKLPHNSGGTITTTTGDSTISYEHAYNNLMALSSFHFVLTAERQPNQFGGPKHLRAEGDYDARSRAWRYTLSTSAASEELDGEWVKLNSTNASYHLMNGGWRRQRLSIVDTTDASIEVMRKAMAPARPDLGRNEPPPLVGTETIEGQECSHYSFTVPAGRSLAGTYDAYLNSHGDFIRLDSLDTVYKYSVVISRQNRPVRISAPN